MERGAMDTELYNAAREGNEEFLERVPATQAEDGEETPNEGYFLSQTPEGENIFHLAAARGQLDFITKALEKLPALVLLICRSNSKGENPLHVASRVGHRSIVRHLIAGYDSHLHDVKEGRVRSMLLSLIMAEEGRALTEPWRAKDSSGNTPLHEALRNGNGEVALDLLEVDPTVAACDNEADESPLFLAAAFSHEDVMEKILSSGVSYSLSGPTGLTPLHTAVYHCSVSAMKILLQKQPELTKKVDNHKKTALHYAAEAGLEEHLEELLTTEKTAAYLRDENGLTPILRAAALGQLQAVRTILIHCPQSITICDNEGRTMLHLMKLEFHQDGIELFKFTALRRLVNEPDHEGDTPLHLAVKNNDHIMANVLLHIDNMELQVRNRMGLTAWDLIKQHPEPSNHMVEIGYQLIMHSRQQQTNANLEKETSERTIHPGLGETRERLQRKFNAVAVIAVVLAAVTFAATFSMPGGINDRGNALLAGKVIFKVFVLSNTVAMCGYMLVLFCVLWAMMISQWDDEPRLLLCFSIRALQLSFYGTLIAFITSIYTVIPATSLWVAITVTCLPPCIVILTVSKSLVLILARIFLRLRVY